MPYTVKKGQGCPENRPYAVVKTATGEVLACHATPEAAGKQIGAINHSEKEKKEETAQEWSERMRAILSTHDVCFGRSLVRVGPAEMIVEVAERKDQWNVGLKYRPTMRHDGMLFKFENHQRADFTMTDVNFDLDVFWYDADRKLLAKSFAAAGTPRVEAPDGYVYALEVPAGALNEEESGSFEIVA